MDIKSLIRTIPDHPKPGIMFRDVTPLFQNPAGLDASIEGLVAPFRDQQIQQVAGIEARGFILGGAVARELNAGFIPVRKPGKLPREVVGEDYKLEYGEARLEIHTDAIQRGERVLLIDDLIATGGSARAAISLIEQSHGIVVGCGFVVDLPELGGSRSLVNAGHTVLTLCSFEGE